MNRILSIALVLASTLAAAGTSSAQDHQIKANVPFNFTVGDQTLPAGTYKIAGTENSPALLTMQNWDKRVNVLAMGTPDGYNSKKQDNVLVFHKYGNQYFLSEIRSEGASMNIDFKPTKAEKRARTQVEEAGRSVDDPVLIALN